MAYDTEESPLPFGWEERFCSRRKRSYFIDHTSRITTWMDPRHLANTSDPSAQLRRKFLYRQRGFRNLAQPGILHIKIRRAHILEDSMSLFRQLTSNDLRRKPRVSFWDSNDPTVDSTREWIDTLTDFFLHDTNGFFELDDTGSVLSFETPPSRISFSCIASKNYLDYFYFMGQVHGIAVFHGLLIDPKMVDVMYPMLTLHVKTVWGQELLAWATNDSANLSATTTFNGELVLTSDRLIDNRTDQYFELPINDQKTKYGIFVSGEDQREFLEAIAAYYECDVDGGRPLRALMNGFWSIISKNCFLSYTKVEVFKYFGGIIDIDCDYHFKLSAEEVHDTETRRNHHWFWNCLRSWPIEHHQALIQYMTSSNRASYTDRFKLSYRPGGRIHCITVVSREKDEEIPVLEHTLFLPDFNTNQAMEGAILQVIRDAEKPELHPYEDLTASRALQRLRSILS